MNGLILPIDPIIAQIGPLVLRWYGLMIGAGIIAGSYVGLVEAERRGIPRSEALNVVTWAVPVAFVFARLFHVLDALPYYVTNPLKVFAINEGGMAIYGGLVGGVVAGFFYAKLYGLPIGKLADAAAPGMILGQAIGRIGCFFNGDHQGVPGNLPWATMYTNPNTVVPDFGVFRHPTQVYEGLFDLAVFGVIWFMRRRIATDGVLFWTYASLYSLGRFWISFLRLDAEFLLGLKEAQVVSLATFMIGVPIILFLLSRHYRTLPSGQQEALQP
jgi:phosphatidylglycerol:prolipoprotein diacylglycerol transferase